MQTLKEKQDFRSSNRGVLYYDSSFEVKIRLNMFILNV